MTDHEVHFTIILAADNTLLMTAGFNLVFDDLLRCQDFFSLISLKHGVFLKPKYDW